MLKSINQEEVYLDWDPSNNPLLQKINVFVERYSSLWHTALDFHENYERWYYGPFLGLDTEAIQTQVCLLFLLSTARIQCQFIEKILYNLFLSHFPSERAKFAQIQRKGKL